MEHAGHKIVNHIKNGELVEAKGELNRLETALKEEYSEVIHLESASRHLREAIDVLMRYLNEKGTDRALMLRQAQAVRQNLDAIHRYLNNIRRKDADVDRVA